MTDREKLKAIRRLAANWSIDQSSICWPFGLDVLEIIDKPASTTSGQCACCLDKVEDLTEGFCKVCVDPLVREAYLPCATTETMNTRKLIIRAARLILK